MTQDTAISIVLQARDNASRVVQTVQQRVTQAQAAIGRTAQQLRTSMTTAVDLSRASTFAYAGAVGLLTTALFSLESQTQTAAAQIAGMSGGTEKDIPKITAQLRNLAKENDASMSDVSRALRVVYRDFKIFNPSDPQGIAQMLLDWQDATNENAESAGKNFRSIILTYFGPDADINKALPETMDKIFSVAKAVGVAPESLAAAVGDLGVTGQIYFGDIDSLLTFLSALGGAGGDVQASAVALRNFGGIIEDIRKAWREGEKPDENAVKALAALGLAPETVQNEAFKVGALMMSALKNAMADNKISTTELDALNVLFGGRVGEDMAKAAGSIDRFSDKAKNALQNFEGAVKNAAATVDENITSKLTQAWNNFTNSIASNGNWQGGVKTLEGLLTTLAGIAKLDLKEIGGGLATLGEGLFKAILGADAADVADALVWWWSNVVTPEWRKFFEPQTAFERLKQGGRLLEAVFVIQPGTVTETVGRWWNGIVQAGAGVFTRENAVRVLNGITDRWLEWLFKVDATQARETISAFWGNVGGWITNTFNRDNITKVGANIWAAIRDGWNGALAGAEDWLKERWNATLSPGFGGWVANALVIGGRLWAAIRDGWSTATENVKAWVEGRWTALSEGFREWTSNASTIGSRLWDNIKNAFTTALQGAEGVKAWALNRWNEFRAEFGKWWTGIVEVGQNIIAGFIKGLNQGWEDVKNNVTSKGEAFIQWWKDILKQRSPSKVMEEIGFFTIQGFTNGLDQAFPGMRQKIQGIVETAISTINQLGPAMDNLAKTGWTQGWASMGAVVKTGLEQIGRYTDTATAGMLSTWGGYIGQFGSLMDKYKGNVLKALGDMLIGIIQQEAIKIAVNSASQLAIAAINAPLTFGATLAAQGPILAAAAAGAIALEALKNQVLGSFAVGTAMVPYDQVAQIHQGEMIIPKTFAEGVRDGSVTIGGGDGSRQPVPIQIWIDGRLLAQVVGRHQYDGVRQLVRADLPAVL